MDTETRDPETPNPHPPTSNSQSVGRQTAEFLVVLCVSVLLFRTFAAEAYVVPTGSMAPTLLGIHQELTCSNCGIRFALGMDERGGTGRAVCPNCGQTGLDRSSAVACNGDRLLVQKFLYDLRPPRRWEVAVFHSPTEPSQAYVKRVVGLPGESVQVADGDVYIDGRIARKTLAEQRAMRLLVYDHNFRPRDIDRYPRWIFRRGSERTGRPWRPSLIHGWKPEGTRFIHEDPGPRSPTPNPHPDWLVYHHWDSGSGRYGPIHDFCPYNGGSEYRGETAVRDVMFEATLTVRPDVRSVVVRLGEGFDRYYVTLPVDDRGEPEVRRNGKAIALTGVRNARLASSTAEAPRPIHLEASLMDRRLTVALDGELAFDPIDDDEPPHGYGPDEFPVALGVVGGGLEVGDLRLYRDVYYTSALTASARRPFGIDVPYRLGAGEYFVLGDNSPVSNDSRFWPDSPVVRADMFLGKPFLVHLPSRGIPLQVFGRELYWIPDPREIRYIR